MLKVAYEEGLRIIEDQVAELDSMRQRSVQFLAFVGSATAFLAGSGLGGTYDRGPAFFVLAGLASLVSAIAIALASFVLLSLVPRRSGSTDREQTTQETALGSDPSESPVPPPAASGRSKFRIERAVFNFQVDPSTLVLRWIEPEMGATEAWFFKHLALHYGEKAAENEPLLDTIRRWYWLFIAFASAQVVLWAMVVWVFAAPVART